MEKRSLERWGGCWGSADMRSVWRTPASAMERSQSLTCTFATLHFTRFILFRRMCEGIDTDYPVAFAPWISPPVDPFTDPRRQAQPRRATRGVLCPCVFLLAHNYIRCKSIHEARLFAGIDKKDTHLIPRNAPFRARAGSHEHINARYLITYLPQAKILPRLRLPR